MHRFSLRKRIFVFAMVSIVVVVGGAALTTDLIIVTRMSVAVRDSALDLASGAGAVIDDLAAETERTSEGQTGERDDAVAREAFLRRLPAVLGSCHLHGGEFVLYDGDLDPVWLSTGATQDLGGEGERRTALESGRTRIAEPGAAENALLRFADLGGLEMVVVHVPVSLPDGSSGVLDVFYEPTHEERAIHDIRILMFVLGASATAVMVFIMQASLLWVLRLVDDLRKAAESIDANDFDVRMPDQGDHEIGELGRAINRLIERLGRRARAQARFVADASHELATPVAGIRGYANILRAWGADDVEVRDEAIEAIDRESSRMARLCGELLALVREDRRVDAVSESFDLNAVSRQILATAATRFAEKGLEFVGPSEDRLIMVGDADRVGDAISILVDNACKFTREGRVGIATSRDNGTVIISVSDTGIGIPEKDTVNVFDRFYRSDVSRSRQSGGFGLGLPIARSIAESAGGSIEVSSVEGEGSVFTIAIPG